jgi:hypothetical protein
VVLPYIVNGSWGIAWMPICVHGLLGCWDRAEAWHICHSRWGLCTLDIWREEVCADGCVWFCGSSAHTGFHIKEMGSAWMAAWMDSYQWSEWCISDD